jgi:hypothetical protein
MGTTSLLIDEQTVYGLEQAAAELGTNAAELAEKAIRRYLREQAEYKIKEEEEFYQAQLPDLLSNYQGRYIALHNGEVIDSDTDELTLYLRVRQSYPTIGVLIKRVTTEPETTWHMRSPRMGHE